MERSPGAMMQYQDGQDRARRRALERTVSLLGPLVVVMAAMVLVGWALGIDSLKSVLPGASSMKPNTALGLMLGAVTLLLLVDVHAGPTRRRLGRLLAATLLALGAATLVEYGFAIDLGIDQLLFRDDTPAPGTFAPGRMSVHAAVMFVLLGGAFLLLDAPQRPGRGMAPWLGLAAGGIAFLALIGHAYGVEPLFGFANATQIAVHTALLGLLLSAGVLLARPDHGFMAEITGAGAGSVVARRLLLAALVFVPLLGYIRLQGQRVGLYGLEAGLALLVMAQVCLLTVLIMWTARSINRAAAGRRLIEERLRKAERLESIGRLAGGVAHDFNNLLTIIMGFGSSAREGLTMGPARADLDMVLDAAQRAAGITGQLLAFGRQQVLEPHVLDLASVVREMEPLLRRLAREDVELTVRAAPNLHHARLDRPRVEQVLLNLVSNARDAMPRGGSLTLEISNTELDASYQDVHPEAQVGPHVMLAVSDTGHGMDAATLARVFEPFFTTKEPGSGTGLGLATVHGIVKQSGGSLNAYSEPGMGTTFKIYFPAVAAPLEAPRPVPERALQRPAATVLLVEDDAAVREVLRRILLRGGYQLLVAAHGGEALTIAEGHAEGIDLLVTDTVMPGMSGPEVAAALTRARPGLRVLFVSGYTDDSISNHGVLERGVAFIGKPVTAAALLKKVEETLESEPSPPGA